MLGDIGGSVFFVDSLLHFFKDSGVNPRGLRPLSS